MKNSQIIKGVTSLVSGTLLVKIIGAIYRIPLTNFLGSTGLGLYQMIFPVYCILLDFSGSGVPGAISKIIASHEREGREVYAVKILKTSLKLLFKIGIMGSFSLILLSYPISVLQGDANAFLGYVTLSPAIFLVGLISCFRGYFQGLMVMNKTAVSQVLEQVFKLAFGLLFVMALMPNVPLAVAGATFAVTISEAVSLAFLFVSYKRKEKVVNQTVVISKEEIQVLNKRLFKITLPITITGIMIPLTHFIDSFVVINVLSTYLDNATSLYGIFSGMVHTVINLPVAVLYSLAVIALPSVSSKVRGEERKTAIDRLILITGVGGAILSIFTYLFSGTVVNLLYPALSGVERETCINLLKLSSPGVLLLSVLQTQNATLVASDKLYVPVVSLGVSVILKTVLQISLLFIPSINIYGSAIASIACYFFAVMINFIILIRGGNKNVGKTALGMSGNA